MPKANSTSTTARRGLLAGASGLAVTAVAGIPAPAAAPDPDADLRAACAGLEAEQAEWYRHVARCDAAGEDIPERPDEAERVDLLWSLRKQIAKGQATTMEGLIAKARAILADYPEGEHSGLSEDAMPAWSLARDLLALAGR